MRVAGTRGNLKVRVGIPEKEEDLANGPADPVPVSRANGQKRDLFCFDFDYKF